MSPIKQCGQKQKFWSNAGMQAFGATIILILGLSACQTASQTQSKASETSSDPDVQTTLAVALSYLDSGRPDKAMHEIQQILNRKPNNIEALNMMGITQLALSNPRRALTHLEKAWKLDPRTATGVNLSSAYYDLERYKDAEKMITTVLKRKETPPYAHKERLFHNYGLVAEKTGRAVLAEKMFRRAVEENPMFYLSHMQLARVYQEKRKLAQASKSLESARFACPVCYDPVAQLVQIQSARGDFRHARQIIQDYKLTEGLSQMDRRRVSDLENNLNATAQRENQDSPQKTR